jgi:hypothetical protein
MREPTWRNWPEVGSRSSCLILKDIAMPKKLSYWILLGLMMISFSSCTNYSNERSLKKFISRFNMKEYASASTYIYPDDKLQLAFFANEVRKKAPNAFVKIDYCTAKDDEVIATLKWVNANDFLRNYFANIGKKLNAEDAFVDKIKVKETVNGPRLVFNWGCPFINTEKLKLARITFENVERMNIRSGAGKNYKVIGNLARGDDILIDNSENGWSRCYQVNNEGQVQVGYIYTKDMLITESAFFTLGIFESMSLLVAVIIIVVICFPLIYLRAIVEAIKLLGCASMFFAVILILGFIYVFYHLLEKILFELFIINLPY